MRRLKENVVVARSRFAGWVGDRWGESSAGGSPPDAEGEPRAPDLTEAPARYIGKYPGVSDNLVGRILFFNDHLAPALFLVLALAAGIWALVSGQDGAKAVMGGSGAAAVVTWIASQKLPRASSARERDDKSEENLPKPP